MFEERSKCCEFLGVVAARDFESCSSLIFYHCFPLFEDSEGAGGRLVEYAINPRIICGFIDKDQKISCIADRDG